MVLFFRTKLCTAGLSNNLSVTSLCHTKVDKTVSIQCSSALLRFSGFLFIHTTVDTYFLTDYSAQSALHDCVLFLISQKQPQRPTRMAAAVVNGCVDTSVVNSKNYEQCNGKEKKLLNEKIINNKNGYLNSKNTSNGVNVSYFLYFIT